MLEVNNKGDEDFNYWDLIEMLNFEDYIDIKVIEGSPSMMEASLGFAPL